MDVNAEKQLLVFKNSMPLRMLRRVTETPCHRSAMWLDWVEPEVAVRPPSPQNPFHLLETHPQILWAAPRVYHGPGGPFQWYLFGVMNQGVFWSQVSPKAPPRPKNPALGNLGSGQHLVHCWHFLGDLSERDGFFSLQRCGKSFLLSTQIWGRVGGQRSRLTVAPPYPVQESPLHSPAAAAILSRLGSSSPPQQPPSRSGQLGEEAWRLTEQGSCDFSLPGVPVLHSG